MQAEAVIAYYTLFLEHGVEVWLDGGWGIDALIQQQSRPHKDLDLIARFDDLPKLVDLLTNLPAGRDFHLSQIWEENRWVPYPKLLSLVGRETAEGYEVATAFVLRNAEGDEFDFHIIQFDEQGNIIAAWEPTFIFPPGALDGTGMILDQPVRCLSAQMQMTTHTGYALQAKDLQDLRHLHERFGVAYLTDQARYFEADGPAA